MLVETLLKLRIEAAITSVGGVSSKHGFSPGRTFLGAIENVVKSVEEAEIGIYQFKRIVLRATLNDRRPSAV